MKINSPLNIKMLLHYYTSTTPHPDIGLQSVQEFTEELLRLGCIEPDPRERGYRTTERGDAWVQSLCNVEVPTVCYVDAHGNHIIKTAS